MLLRPSTKSLLLNGGAGTAALTHPASPSPSSSSSLPAHPHVSIHMPNRQQHPHPSPHPHPHPHFHGKRIMGRADSVDFVVPSSSSVPVSAYPSSSSVHALFRLCVSAWSSSSSSSASPASRSQMKVLRVVGLLFLCACVVLLLSNLFPLSSSVPSNRWYLHKRNLNFAAIADRVQLKQVTSRIEQEHKAKPQTEVDNQSKRRYIHQEYCNSSSPCVFPTPSSGSLYATAVTDSSACIGHQFTQWVYGPYLSVAYGTQYVYTPFTGHAAEFNEFLGFGAGEQNNTNRDTQATVTTVKGTLGVDAGEIHEWMQKESLQHQVRMDDAKGRDESAATVLSVNVAVSHYGASKDVSCHPVVNLIMRQKYCLARVHESVPVVDLFVEDRVTGLTSVALSLQCGDGCYGGERFLPVNSIITTIHHLQHTLKKAKLPPPSVHFFVENGPAHNHNTDLADSDKETVSTYFETISNSHLLQTTVMHLHQQLSAPALLHQLIIADIFVASNSPFSAMAQTLRSGPTIAHSPACTFSVAGYFPDKGIFNRQVLSNAYKDSRKWAITEFRDKGTCHQMRRWDELTLE